MSDHANAAQYMPLGSFCVKKRKSSNLEALRHHNVIFEFGKLCLQFFIGVDFPRLKWHLTDVTSSIFSAAFLASSIVKSFNKNLGNTLLNQGAREAIKNTEKKGRVDVCYLELRMKSPVQRWQFE